jgi:hypothetical protein
MHRVIILALTLPLVSWSCLENRNMKTCTAQSVCVSFLFATFTANMYPSNEYLCDRYDILVTFVLWTRCQISMLRTCLCCTSAIFRIMYGSFDEVCWNNNYRKCIGYNWTILWVLHLPNLQNVAKTTAPLLLATILASHKQPRNQV